MADPLLKPGAASPATVLPAVTALVTALVWPLFTVWIIWFLAHHHETIVADIKSLSPYIANADVHAGPFQLTAQTRSVAAAGIASALASPPVASSAASGTSTASAVSDAKLAAVSPDYAKILAAGAVSNLDSSSIAAASKALRVLWVDPHPGNNINLQVAFQKLGFVVVTVQDDSAVPQAFKLANSFDVVITNMTRTNAPEAGLQTVRLINSINSKIPVIIYSAGWSATHLAEEGKYGVKLITYRTDEVFQTVVNIAQNLDRSNSSQ